MGTSITRPDAAAAATVRRRSRIGRRRRSDAADEPSQRALDYIEAQNIAVEVTLHRTMAATAASSLLLVLALWPAIGTELAMPGVCICLALAAYFALMSMLFERGHADGSPVLTWIGVTVEASIGTLVLAVIAHVKGGGWTLSSPAQLLYPLFLAIVGIRMQPVLCLYATALSATQLMVLHAFVLVPDVDAAAARLLPTLGAWTAGERIFWLALTGAACAFGAARARDLALFGGRQAWERRKLHLELGRYVSSDVAEAILRGEAPFGQAERREVTVLCCDLRDFTALTERDRPEAVVAILNTFYEGASAVVTAHGGTINKLLGDSLLVLFGAPDDQPNHEVAAAEAAHDLVAVADELRDRGGPWTALDVGIGLDSGEIIVGAIGAPSRLDYTAIGPAVHRAARLQALTRDQPHRIVLSHACLAGLGPQANVVPLGTLSIDASAEPETVYAFRY